MSGIEKLNGLADKVRAKTSVTDKLSIVDMTHLLDDLKWGKENWLKGTSDQFTTLTPKGWGMVSTSYNNDKIDISSYPDGTTFTYSCTATNPKNDISLCLEIMPMDGSGTQLFSLAVHSEPFGTVTSGKPFSVTITKTSSMKGIIVWIVAAYESGTGDPIQVKDERLYEGTEPGVWTPNPADKVGGVIKPVLSIFRELMPSRKMEVAV